MYRLNTVKMPTTMFTMINQRVRRLMKLSMCSAVGSRVMKGLSSGCTGYLFRNCLRRWAAYASPKTMPSQSRVLVIMCVSCQLCTLFIFTKLYQEAAPYQTHRPIRVRRRLPNITGSCARGAKPIGGFGLVTGPITILYHGAILAGILPQGAFTKHHRLVTRTGIIRYENYMCGERMRGRCEAITLSQFTLHLA